MTDEQKLLNGEEAEAAGTELFRIKPLEWQDYLDGMIVAVVFCGHYKVSGTQWYWFAPNGNFSENTCSSPEEGKQLAEQHWREYVRQALIEVKR